MADLLFFIGVWTRSLLSPSNSTSISIEEVLDFRAAFLGELADYLDEYVEAFKSLTSYELPDEFSLSTVRIGIPSRLEGEDVDEENSSLASSSIPTNYESSFGWNLFLRKG